MALLGGVVQPIQPQIVAKFEAYADIGISHTKLPSPCLKLISSFNCIEAKNKLYFYYVTL